MRCEQALQALLEADPEALQPGSPGPLGEHLATCGRCRRAAQRILAGAGMLDRWLDIAPPTLDVDAVVMAGLGEGARTAGPTSAAPELRVRADAASGRSEPSRARTRVGAHSTALPWILPFAAAAGAALLLFVSGAPEEEPVPPSGGEAPVARAGPPRDLDLSTDRHVAVLATRDPDITIIWFYGEGP